MDEFNELSEIDILNAEIAQYKQILTGVKTAKSTPDEAREKLVAYCQGNGAADSFMKADPGKEQPNIYHNNVKNSASGGGDSGGCCVAS